MALSTQPYINAVESAIISTGRTSNPISYPAEFNTDIAELFGYILMAGTMTRSRVSCEINFVDCHHFTEMPKRIEQIYSECWGNFFLRKNPRQYPKLCGKKLLAFVALVFDGEQNILAGQEKIPNFVWDSNSHVQRAFLKGLLGPSPKVIRESKQETWMAFRNPKLLFDVMTLLEKVTTAKFKIEPGFIAYIHGQLEILKKELDLEHPTWWSSTTALKLG
jgi:hypothetical protein